jgi:hypothetical protein
MQAASTHPTPPDGRGRASRAAALLGAALLGLGAAVRCRQYLGVASYWYDEAYLLLNVRARDFAHLLGAVDYQVVIPPGFLWLLRGFYLLFGSSEWAMRLPAAAAGLAALLLAVPLARRLAGSPGWLWGVGFCALSAHAVMHACEVRPYAFDLLLAEAVFLAAWVRLSPDAGGRGPTAAAAGLLAAALLGPWLSFPSAFVLAGAGLALSLDACRRPSRGRWLFLAAFAAAAALSGGAMWLLSARDLYYPGLREHWLRGFPDLSSAAACLRWTAARLVGVADYAAGGVGLPLLALAVGGVVVVGRRNLAAAVLLVAPLALGFAAAFRRSYPMDDRTVFFAAPCVWLPAAAAVGAILEALRGRARVAAACAAALLLAPGAVEAAKELVAVEPRVEFRGAFDYVHEHWADGDLLWALHGEVHEVYYGASDRLLGPFTPASEVAAAARRSRLWLVYSPPYQGRPGGPADAVRDQLNAAGCVRVKAVQFRGLEVALYEPPAN